MRIETPFIRLQGHVTPEKFYPMLLLTLVSMGFIALLLPGIPQGHDLPFHLARLQGMADGLAAGQFPVRINFGALNEYGYATGLFYPDIFLYPAALLVLLGVPIVTAYKLFLFCWGIFSAFSMYYAAKTISRDSFTGFAAALLYAWNSYLACDIFTRAALGEYLSFPFLPWIMLGCWRLIYDDARRFLPCALGFAGLCLAHNITFLLMSLTVGIYMAMNLPRFLREPARIGWTVLAAATAGGLSLVYLAPFLEQLASGRFYLTTQTLLSPIAERMVPLTRLFLELPYMKTEFWIPPGIGIIFVVVFLQRFRFRARQNDIDRFRDATLIIGAVSLLCATSFLPWEGMMRVLAGIQFPWRFYLQSTAFLALGGGLILGKLTSQSPVRQRYWIWILLCGCGFAWYFNVAYTYAAKIHEHKIVRSFTSAEAGRLAASGLHYLPAGADLAMLQTRGDRVVTQQPAVTDVRRLAPGKLKVEFQENTGANTFELPLVPYKGYRARLDSLPLATGKSAAQLLTVKVPETAKSGTIVIEYAGTPIQRGSFYISTLLLAVIIVIGVRNKRRSRHVPVQR